MLTARETSSHFASFWKAVNTKRERLEHLCECLVQQKALLATEGSAINIQFRSVHFHPPCLPHPPFQFFKGLDPRLVLALV